MKLMLIGILGIIIMFVALFMIKKYEGFSSGSILTVGNQQNVPLPMPSQESAIPNSMPGSVTVNPDTSMASTQDIIAARDAIKLFNESVVKLNQTDAMYNIIDSPNTPDDKKALLTYFMGMGDVLQFSFNNALTSTSITLPVKDVTNIRSTVENLTNYILTTSNVQPYNAPEMKASDTEIKGIVSLLDKYNNAINKNKLTIIQSILNSTTTISVPKEVLVSFVGSLPVYLNGIRMIVEKRRTNTLTKKDYDGTMKFLNDLDKFVKVDKSKVTSVVPNNQSVISKTTKPSGISSSPTSLSSTQRPSLLQRGKAVPVSPLAGRTALYEIAGPYLNKNDLQELVNRIQAQRKKLIDLRSNAASIRARVDQLEKLAADVSAIRVQVVRGTMKPEDIPIETESARLFLKGVENDPLPPLISPKGETTKTATDFAHAKGAPGVAAGSFGVPMDTNVQKLMESAKDLKWSIEATVMYDPSVAQRDKLIERLAGVEKALNKITVKGEEVSKDEIMKLQKELGVLTSILNKSSSGTSFVSGLTGDVRPELPLSTRIPTSSLTSSVYVPSKESVKNASGSDKISDGISPDVYSRPGMLMTDEAIKRRASGSQPIEDDMKGRYDYKQRVIDVCNQIKSSGLGDPVKFGCIADPSQVGASYSWKGAYKMVCSRLGHTWGGFYPEMFGCGKYDAVSGFDGSAL